MADEQHTVRNVSWGEVFSFSHIFKSFKMAIHPSKIMLALVAITLTCVLGLVMDRIWSVSDEATVIKDEAWAYWVAPSRGALMQQRTRWLDVDRVNSLALMLEQYPDITKEPAKMAKEDFSKAIGKIEDKLADAYGKDLKKAENNWIEEGKRIKGLPEDQRSKATDDAKHSHVLAQQQALGRYVTARKSLAALAGNGVFGAFLDWEGFCLRNALAAVRRGNIASGLADLYAQRGNKTPRAYRTATVTNVPDFDATTNDPEGYGVLAWCVLMAWGLWSMASIHWFYAIVYILAALAVWSILGGAICRIAALHAAREEKISMTAAVKFGMSKFVSFFTAPVLPIVIVVVMGFFLAFGGFIGGLIPYVGEWFVALLFPLALILGAIIAFVTIGLAGGWPLMWPTIAAEGSDAFDAISRSFSYIYARPFRYGLYWLVAAVYGTICYLFVRLFAFLTLLATHTWAGWAMRLSGQEHYALGAGKLDVMWARPTFESFHGPWQFEAMTRWTEQWTAVILSVWVYLVAGIVLAFLATFLFSAATNIYYLLRQKVDATDLDDVYIEEEEEAPALPDEAAPEGAEAPAEQPPAEENPAEEADEAGEDKPE